MSLSASGGASTWQRLKAPSRDGPQQKDVLIAWDIENARPPTHIPVSMVEEAISNAFHYLPRRKRVGFFAAVSLGALHGSGRRQQQELAELCNYRVTVVLAAGGAKSASADAKLLQQIDAFIERQVATGRAARSVLVLITGDDDFTTRVRRALDAGMDVQLLHPGQGRHASSHLLSTVRGCPNAWHAEWAPFLDHWLKGLPVAPAAGAKRKAEAIDGASGGGTTVKARRLADAGNKSAAGKTAGAVGADKNVGVYPADSRDLAKALWARHCTGGGDVSQQRLAGQDGWAGAAAAGTAAGGAHGTRATTMPAVSPAAGPCRSSGPEGQVGMRRLSPSALNAVAQAQDRERAVRVVRNWLEEERRGNSPAYQLLQAVAAEHGCRLRVKPARRDRRGQAKITCTLPDKGDRRSALEAARHHLRGEVDALLKLTRAKGLRRCS
ncbi:hypothetical protein HYH02_009639 [Chlamydomonas schloesseri]|uniref:NYN domain-containing protein n=1 Tax=Chlamydomonas schloesseri TaxID=2026947 RepID=A0A835W9S1_9CHLO|nr:hypothetical protein HYH02_009639 [Chlamydomonas schloesseri]|eukprot:KAG2442151.1 hypothetical protein HYH02_009639 [Chlamydomonas schloesseri]